MIKITVLIFQSIISFHTLIYTNVDTGKKTVSPLFLLICHQRWFSNSFLSTCSYKYPTACFWQWLLKKSLASCNLPYLCHVFCLVTDVTHSLLVSVWNIYKFSLKNKNFNLLHIANRIHVCPLYMDIILHYLCLASVKIWNVLFSFFHWKQTPISSDIIM